jgi:mRNA interferase MazF
VQRGELYRIKRPNTRAGDPREFRVFVVVSRQALIDSRFSSVICAPVFSAHDGLGSQVEIGVDEGLKFDSSIHCDELVSLPKSMLTDFIGRLSDAKLFELDQALRVALDLPNAIL